MTASTVEQGVADKTYSTTALKRMLKKKSPMYLLMYLLIILKNTVGEKVADEESIPCREYSFLWVAKLFAQVVIGHEPCTCSIRLLEEGRGTALDPVSLCAIRDATPLV
ncbi:hypothetical protein TSAR_001540, partial [Trichomalopsis sarcophagae]